MNGLRSDLADAMTPTQTDQVRAMSDDEVEARTRNILIKRGYPEAATASKQEISKMVRADIGKIARTEIGKEEKL